MHVKEGLFFDKHTGMLIGYSDLGEINNLLSDYEQHQNEAKRAAVNDEVTYYKAYSNPLAMEVVDNLNDDASLELALTVKKMLQFNNYSSYGRFANYESLYTANLCDTLTKFLQHDNHCCLYQVTLHTASRPAPHAKIGGRFQDF